MKKNYVLLSGLFLASTLGFSQKIVPDEVIESQSISNLSVQLDKDLESDLLKKKKNATKVFNDTLYYEDFDSTGTGGIPQGWAVVNRSLNNFIWKWADVLDRGPFTQNTNEISSTTAANGFLSLPSDFYNIGTGAVSMNTYAQSPIITNGASPFPPTVLVSFQQYYRFCCTGTDVQELQVSTDNFASFDTYDITPGEVGNASNTANAIAGEITVINISCTAGGADSLQFRINADGHSNYFWMIDDFAVVDGATNDISISTPYLEFNEANYTYYPFYGQIPYELFPPLPLFANLVNEGEATQTNVRLVGSVDHINTPGNLPGTGLGNVYNIATLTPGGGSIIGPLCDSTVPVLTGQPRFVPNVLGVFEAQWNVLADSMDQNTPNNFASRAFTTTDTVFARDDNNFGGGIGPASFVDGATRTPGGTTVGDRFATMYIVESRTGAASIPTSITFGVSDDTRNTGVEIVPKIWAYDEDSLTVGLDEAFVSEVASSFSTYTVSANDLGNFITLKLTTGSALLNGLDSGQYAVGWEVTNLPMGTTFEVSNDASSAPDQVPLSTFNYLAHAPAAGWGWVQGNPVIRLNMGNLAFSTGIDSKAVSSAQFEVAPNPSNGEFKLTISSEAPTSFNLNVRNMLGQMVFSSQVQVNGTKIERMDLSNLEKGVYFVTLENENDKLLKKVVLK